MKYYTEELLSLQSQIMEKARTDAKLKDLYIQQQEMEKQTESLRKIMKDEQEDVDRLNRNSFTALFYKATGKMGEKLSKEEEEAFAAAVKYDTANRELQAVKEDITYYENKLLELKDCEVRYQELLEAQIDAVKASNIPEAKNILELERELAGIKNQEKEIREALDAGEKALCIAEKILQDFEKAKTWGTVDLIGGGAFADIMKYDKLDKIQNRVQELQSALRSFRTELADVNTNINGNIHVEIGSFLHFADYLFDGLFADWMVYDKIKQGAERAKTTYDQIQSILNRLKEMEEEIRARQENFQKELEKMAVSI